MDDRDRAAPIALARYAPVTKPVSCLASASVGGGNGGNRGGFASLDIKTVPIARINQLSRASIGVSVTVKLAASSPSGNTTGKI